MQLILNKNNRLSVFKDLFEWLSKKGYGKLSDSHFTAATDVTCTPKNEAETLFAYLQNEAYAAGFRYNCYCFNIK